MDSRFSHLRERDTSVSMLRVKMSRRRSQTQKENRDRMVNTRRNLGTLQELEVSCLDATANMSVIKQKVEKTNSITESKIAEQSKKLQRWKERKALEKEKEKRLKERKGVFKTGLYHHNDATIFGSSATSTKAKEKKVNLDTSNCPRVTRSMRQQPVKVQESLMVKNAQRVVDKPARTRAAPVKSAPTIRKAHVPAVEPVVRALSTRSARRPPLSAAPADARVTRSRAIVRPLPRSTPTEAATCPIVPAVQEPVPLPPQIQQTEDTIPVESSEEENALTVESKPQSPSPSFAPEGFVFQAPAGLTSFKFDPLSPRSAEAFLTTSPSFNISPCPMLTDNPPAESKESNSPKSSPTSSPCPPPTAADPGSPLESNHDVPYFRSVIVIETTKLTDQSLYWESKVEEKSIPEEMRDRMLLAVGQARLLMRERFKQFSGLVDDCELGRGEKITTCTDLQGFWDMIYFQVEDVNRKFDALKAAEGRDWVEEHKPAPRQRKIVKKAAAAPSKAAAKSRLAAIKAAMKAKKQEAEDSTKSETTGESQPKVEAQTGDTVVFDGGFFTLESPAKPPVSVRRSLRLSAAMLPPSTPRSSYLTPRRSTRRSNALAQTPTCVLASPAPVTRTPTHFRLTLEQTPAPKSKSETPQNQEDTDGVHLSFSSVKEELSRSSQLERSLTKLSQTASTEDISASVPELNTSIQLPSTVVVPVVVEQEEPMDDPSDSLRLSLPLVSNPTPELSFTLSPAEHGPMETQTSGCQTPDTSITDDTPGLDTRYFQPHRCSLSPLQTVATETLSPMVVDVEMESPRGQDEDQIEEKEQDVSMVSSLLSLQSTQVQTAESALLLFTPDVQDRIRQSMCPRDLMVFTPPNK